MGVWITDKPSRTSDDTAEWIRPSQTAHDESCKWAPSQANVVFSLLLSLPPAF